MTTSTVVWHDENPPAPKPSILEYKPGSRLTRDYLLANPSRRATHAGLFHQHGRQVFVGVDRARADGDETVVVGRRGDKIVSIEVLPDGLFELDGRLCFDCIVCGESAEWPGEAADFKIDEPHNVCGRSPRCCP